jgi:hypothetical protein
MELMLNPLNKTSLVRTPIALRKNVPLINSVLTLISKIIIKKLNLGFTNRNIIKTHRINPN